VICPKCNQTVVEGARFCGNCGATLSPPVSPGGTLIRPSSPSGGSGGTSASVSGGAASAAAGGANPASISASWPGLIARVKNILLSPNSEWPVIEPEPTTIAQLYTAYVIPLAGLAAVMTFLQMSVIGVGFGFVTFRLPFLNGLTYALLRFGSALLVVFIVGVIIDMLAPTFSGQRDQRQAVKTVAYAFTPVFLASVVALLPWLGPLLALAAALYSIYLLYLGLPLMTRSPRDKAVGYTAAVVVCAILLAVVLNMIIARTVGLGGFGAYGGLH